jgi:hypothetical protein
MKRKLKKLTLSRETLLSLDEVLLREVGGAASWEPTNCLSCEGTCRGTICGLCTVGGTICTAAC